MAHEDLKREHHVDGSSDRSFGLVFAAVFLIIAFWPLLKSQSPRWWSAGIAVAFAVVAFLRPSLLSALNRWWLKLGLLLGRIVSPIALGLLFFLALTPIASLMRLLGKDPLLLRREPEATSYWRRREPPGPRPDSMNQQF